MFSTKELQEYAWAIDAESLRREIEGMIVLIDEEEKVVSRRREVLGVLIDVLNRRNDGRNESR